MESHPTARLVFGQTRYVSFETVTSNRMHRHSYYEPCIVISGSGEFEHGPAVYQLRPGDLFVADRGVYHEIRSLETRDLKLCFLSFHVVTTHGAPTDSLLDSSDQAIVTDFLHEHRTHLAGQSHLIPLFEHVLRLVRRDKEYRQNRNYQDASRLLIRQIVSALADTASLSEATYSDLVRKRRVEDYVERHLHEPLRIAGIAAACGMSERTLRRKWSDWSTSSLPEHIRHRRIERACQLLLLPDIAISDVAYQVGVLNAPQFSRQFKAIKGITPREYRQRFFDGLPHEFSDAGLNQTEYRDVDSP